MQNEDCYKHVAHPPPPPAGITIIANAPLDAAASQRGASEGEADVRESAAFAGCCMTADDVMTEGRDASTKISKAALASGAQIPVN